MSFRLHFDEPFGRQVGALATVQLTRAIDGLRTPEAHGVDHTVHDVRVRLKRVRGLLRLARPAMDGGYGSANAELRDAARDLSALRDAHALIGTFDDLVRASHVDRVDRAAVDAIRCGLATRASRAVGEEAVSIRLRRAAERLESVRDRIPAWRFDDDPALLVAGVTDTYGRGRAAFRASARSPGDARLHEWRKRAKYGWQQAHLLTGLAPSVIEPMAVSLKELADALGDDHDLAVLRWTLRSSPEEAGIAMADVLAALDAVRADLQDRSLRLGARVYAEPPRAFGRRIGRYRTAWDRFGAERSTGEISALARDASDRPPRAAAVS